jgi:hypothetical protein
MPITSGCPFMKTEVHSVIGNSLIDPASVEMFTAEKRIGARVKQLRVKNSSFRLAIHFMSRLRRFVCQEA